MCVCVCVCVLIAVLQLHPYRVVEGRDAIYIRIRVLQGDGADESL